MNGMPIVFLVTWLLMCNARRDLRAGLYLPRLSFRQVRLAYLHLPVCARLFFRRSVYMGLHYPSRYSLCICRRLRLPCAQLVCAVDKVRVNSRR